MNKELQGLVEQWLAWDRNPQTRNEIQQLKDANNVDELQARLAKRIGFGTAGLRAAMGAGFSRMNDLVIVQATQGFAKYLIESPEVNVREQGVVIGHDHRYNSERFAQLAAGVFLHQGIKVYFFRQLVHTPMVPFTVARLDAAAGIMITASHNPKQDNGYKVYWANGCQIIPPHDVGIASQILQNLEPKYWDTTICEGSPLSIDPRKSAKGDMIDEYFAELTKLSKHAEENAKISEKYPIVYTAMHGVGYPFAKRAFECFQLKPFVSVKEQQEPDPDFPTVKFPNPEEGKDSLDMAIKLADSVNAKVILANDPDADRLALAEKNDETGNWVVFNGNAIGALLAYFLYQEAISKEKSNANKKWAVLASTVSSKFLKRFAEVEGLTFRETLTGFKWIGNAAIDMEKEGYSILMAFEEAIGFMVSPVVKDKDGVTAAVVLAEQMVQVYKSGLTFQKVIEQLNAKYGMFISNNSYVVCNSPPNIKKIFDEIRYDDLESKKLSYPKKCGNFEITSICDLTVGYDSSTPDNKPLLPVDASSQMIMFVFANGATATLRTSGTEPKIKYYIELSSAPKSSTLKESLEKELSKLSHAIVEELLKPDANGLIRRSTA